MYPKSPFLRNPLVEAQLLKRNPNFLIELLCWLTQAPTITTYRVNLLRTTTADFKLKLEQLLAHKYGQNRPQVFTIPQLPELVCMDKLCSATATANNCAKEVMVDVSCAAAILRGAHIYAPGVLSMETGTQLNELVDVYADLEGKCKKGTNIRYESAEKMYLGQGRVCMQRHQLYNKQDNCSGIAIEMLTNISQVPSLGDLSSCDALLQNLPSIVCVRVLNPQPGERVLDMCASPGNKTSHIAELMSNSGSIVALDKTEKKIDIVKNKIEQNQLSCIEAFAWDSTKSYDATLQEFAGNSPPFAAASFDRILLDAPCSALGNRPLLASKMSPKMLESFPKVQRKLFENAVPLLKRQGVLVYSTCTVSEQENEQMVAWVLQKFPEMQLVPAEPVMGGVGLPNAGLNEQQRYFVQRFGPASRSNSSVESLSMNTVGFFIAKFIKQ